MDHEFQSIKLLAIKPDIIINMAEKIGSSINTTGWYIKDYFRQQNDDQVYCEIPYEKLNTCSYSEPNTII